MVVSIEGFHCSRRFILISTCVFLCVVVIWSDLLGDFHLWESALLWDHGNEHTETAEVRRETGETQQFHCN